MAKEPDEFVSVMEAEHVKPGMLLCSVADLYKSDWYVEVVAQRVKDRFMLVTMRPVDGGKAVTSAIDPSETVGRKIHKTASAAAKL